MRRICGFPVLGAEGTAHLYPAPDGGEEGGGVDDGNRVDGFWVVGGGEFRGLL